MSCRACGNLGYQLIHNEVSGETREETCWDCRGPSWTERPRLTQKQVMERVYEALEKAYERMRKPG